MVDCHVAFECCQMLLAMTQKFDLTSLSFGSEELCAGRRKSIVTMPRFARQDKGKYFSKIFFLIFASANINSRQ